MPIETARLLNFHKTDDGWYCFRWTAQGEDFAQALAELKTMRIIDRQFDPVTKTWSLRIGPGTDRLLAETFSNGAQVVGAVKAQLSLW
jgi:hypothetical protein